MPSAIRLGPSLQTSEGKRERRARCDPTTIRNQSKFDRPPMPHVTVRTYKAVSRACAYPSEGGSGVRALRITAVEWSAKIAVEVKKAPMAKNYEDIYILQKMRG